MKAVALAILILSTGLAAQTQPAQGTQANAQGPRQQHMAAMQEHMQAMKAQIAQMQANVDQMKANAASIKDPAAKKQAELDAQMWQAMVDHMKSMENMMAEHMAPGGMHQHMHNAGPKSGTPPPSTQPQ